MRFGRQASVHRARVGTRVQRRVEPGVRVRQDVHRGVVRDRCRGGGTGAGSMGSRAQCASSFGVHDMHGLVFEWTDSNWGRGTSGGLVTTRGGYGPNGELASRCANGQGRAPLEKAAVVGFRCCSGAKNTADVNITNTKQPALVEEPSVDAALNTRLIAALPKEQRAVPNSTVSFEKIFRWHPRPNEEILLARWVAKPTGAGTPSFRPMAFKISGNQTHLLAQPRGGVDKAQNPATGAEPQRSSVHVGLGTNEGDLVFNYVFGRVGIEQPAFVKGNAGVDAGAPSSRREVAPALRSLRWSQRPMPRAPSRRLPRAPGSSRCAPGRSRGNSCKAGGRSNPACRRPRGRQARQRKSSPH